MATIVTTAKSMVEVVETAYASIDKSNFEQVEHWIKICSKNIRTLNMALKNADSIGTKSNLQSAIGKITGFRVTLKAALIRGGAVRTLTHPNNTSWAKNRLKWEDLKSVFRGRIRTGCIVNLTHKDPIEFFEDCGPLFVRRIANMLKKEAFLKVNSVFCGKFVKASKNDEIEDYKYLSTKNAVISRDTNLAEWFAEKIMNPILTELGEFQERDSGWALREIVNVMININKYTPQLGSSYIELPKQIKRKEACINVKNNDNACFAWAVMSALYPAKHGNNPDRTSSYPHYSTVLNLEGIAFPISRADVEKFEKQNDISINIYILNKKKKEYTVAPTRLTKEKRRKHINLLLVQNRYDEEESEASGEPIRYHYAGFKTTEPSSREEALLRAMPPLFLFDGKIAKTYRGLRKTEQL